MIAVYLAVVLLLLLLLVAAFAVYAFRVAFYSSPSAHRMDPKALPSTPEYDPLRGKMSDLVDAMTAVPAEVLTVTSYDGLRLYAKYYHVKDGAPVLLFFHGYRSGAVHDGCGGFAMAMAAGMNCLAVDQRAHGDSEGRVISFGVRERYDCQTWAKFAAERFGAATPLFLTGISMGAATVLMASDLELPDSVCGIVADCPYSSPRAILCKVMRDRHLPPCLAYPFLRLSARVLGHFDPDAASALTSVRHTRLPVLLIHGESDDFVPCAMSEQIRDACASPVQLVTFPGAKHGMSYFLDPDRYTRIRSEFLTSHLPGASLPLSDCESASPDGE